ncbi:hypothetical protein PHAMO_210163 [Magnetospirillum molischianum DSM 120]|uniref:Uncharacterized protein n=1 Tax=Magnetospirillum molischianum DSM 120 TaxID=1150626 RepID=H8FQL4_MAGML|nr:hypothetical protein PHAMO_210163 [Magnetospirillum molischianum DSM 120]
MVGIAALSLSQEYHTSTPRLHDCFYLSPHPWLKPTSLIPAALEPGNRESYSGKCVKLRNLHNHDGYS